MVEKLFIFEYRQPSFWEYFFSKHFLRVDSTSKQYHSSEKEVYGQLFALEKCFQICYVYEKRKPMYFLFFISSYFEFYQGIHKIKLKHPQNEKRKKLHGFSFYINIANFEAFLQVKKLSANLFFLKSALLWGSFQSEMKTFCKPLTNPNSPSSCHHDDLFSFLEGIIWPSICLYSSLEILMNGE